MAIVYPGGIDAFNVPTDPEDTPLSEAGTSTRNHVQLHADVGAAVVALEQNTAQLAHDHSGSLSSISVSQSGFGTIAINDMQTVTITGSPTAGTFTLLCGDGTTTNPIAYNATSSAVQSALTAFLGTGNVSVAGNTGGPWQIVFTGTLANSPQTTMVATSSITGGSVSVSHTTIGSSGGNSSYQVTINGAPTGGTFTLTFDDSTTTALPYNASASAVQLALASLTPIGTNNVVVTGNAGGPYYITLQGTLGNSLQPPITATANFTGGLFATNKLDQVNTHQNVDTDVSTSSIHHTIGMGATQAAAGNHIHDYNGPTIINKPYWICTSTTRPSAPEIGEIIWETDTNCVRAWASFPNNTLETGTSFTDTFNRVSPGVNWDATGSGDFSIGTNTLSGTHPIGANAGVLFVSISNLCPEAPSHVQWDTNTTVYCGQYPMNLIGAVDNASSLTGFVAIYGLNIVASMGIQDTLQNISVNAETLDSPTKTAALIMESVSYNNACGWSNIQTAGAVLGIGVSVDVPSSPGDMVFAACSGGLGNIVDPTQTQRAYAWPGDSYCSVIVEDAPGAWDNVSIGCDDTAITGAEIGFNIIAASSTLGSGYNQAYVSGASPQSGQMAVPASGAASWIMGQNSDCRCIATPTTSTTTLSNDQDFQFTTGTAFPLAPAGWGNSPTVDIYARQSTDGQSYVRLALGSPGAWLLYSTSGPANETQLASVTTGTQSTDIDWEFKITGNTFILYRGGVQVLSWVDTQNVTMSGTTYRGWSWGMSAVSGFASQYVPATVTSLTVTDLPIYTTQPIWQLLNLGSVPYIRAETHIEQEIAVQSTVAAFFDTILEDLFGFFGLGTIATTTTIPQTTGITIGEAGHYNIHASIPFDPTYYGFDNATLGFTVNGQDIGRKTWQFMRGNTYAPGFAQTLELFFFWKFAAGDVLRVVVATNSDAAAWLYYDNSSSNTQMVSLDLQFLGP